LRHGIAAQILMLLHTHSHSTRKNKKIKVKTNKNKKLFLFFFCFSFVHCILKSGLDFSNFIFHFWKEVAAG
jgi:hypothetical protein